MAIRLDAGPITDITNWFKDQFLALWNAFAAFIGDSLLALCGVVLDLFATAIESLTPPEFLTTYSLDGLLGQAGPTIVWIASTFRIGEGLALLAAGFAFRLLRKLFTLGQW